ncbi:hypothetical protein [Desulfosporosinus sp. BG]|nr:hypothetical protein [Desulfosporosinus sp. BG]ODA42151.1 hypothetical protein DSBG_0979 [Desulfosporosinus sp. BG]
MVIPEVRRRKPGFRGKIATGLGKKLMARDIGDFIMKKDFSRGGMK